MRNIREHGSGGSLVNGTVAVEAVPVTGRVVVGAMVLVADRPDDDGRVVAALLYHLCHPIHVRSVCIKLPVFIPHLFIFWKVRKGVFN